MKYLIEFMTTTITPVTTTANSPQEAIKQALNGKGSIGDPYTLEQDKEVYQVRELGA